MEQLKIFSDDREFVARAKIYFNNRSIYRNMIHSEKFDEDRNFICLRCKKEIPTMHLFSILWVCKECSRKEYRLDGSD